MKKEITHLIERLELLEEKFGIALSGIYASCETPGAFGNHDVTLNFDIASLNGEALARSFCVCASAYNSAGQLLQLSEFYVDNEKFMGFTSKCIQLRHLDQTPEKIRLFPTVS